MWGRLVACTFALDGVREGHSQVSPSSSRAVFLVDLAEERSPETSLAPGKRLEPVHLHAVSDTSVHVVLPAGRGADLTALGWGEPHQYEDFGTEFLIYGPRTDAELDVVLAIIGESLAFARGDLLVSDPLGVWDRRYLQLDQLWSGQPNGVLVAEAHGLARGRVLDVGCGEGADVVWLAENGWDVTALDVSLVALDRAAAEADRRGLAVTWVHAGLVEAALPAGSFDLVSAQYPALLRTDDALAEHALLDAVAIGGVLLVVHHPAPTAEEALAHGFNLDDYVGLAQVAALLDDRWEIEVDETRPRHVATGGGSHHTQDVVLRARRLG
ncbi:MAG: class I SAM-dependent methyltransferase [Burkholderiaceae bacterium]|nr:class I SAM-dependent methyltransferase [Microbacteriaceae bacterium]